MAPTPARVMPTACALVRLLDEADAAAMPAVAEGEEKVSAEVDMTADSTDAAEEVAATAAEVVRRDLTALRRDEVVVSKVVAGMLESLVNLSVVVATPVRVVAVAGSVRVL